MARLRELWAETEKLGGDEPIWAPFPLYAADLIAKGVYKISYPFDPETVEQVDDPVAEYAQIIHATRTSFHLQPRPAEPAVVRPGPPAATRSSRTTRTQEAGRRTASTWESSRHSRHCPSRLISGTLHEAFDAYGEHDVKKHNIRPGDGSVDALRQPATRTGGAVSRITTRTSRCRALNYDLCEEMIRHWRQRPPHKKSGESHRKGQRTASHQRTGLLFSTGWIRPDRFAWTKPRGNREDRPEVEGDR